MRRREGGGKREGGRGGLIGGDSPLQVRLVFRQWRAWGGKS